MPLQVVSVQPLAPELEIIQKAAQAIREGKLVAFPTETVYGLGANALDPHAVAGIFRAKGRPATNPLIVHLPDETEVLQVAANWPEKAHLLARKFWPGPLTLVVPKSPKLPDAVTAGGPTVAVRCPAHPVAHALLQAANVPIAAPSANRSGQLSPTTAAHVQAGLGDEVELLLDGGPCPGGIESTVVDVCGPTVRLLRAGPITISQLEEVIGPVELGSTPQSGPLPAPGMLNKHYSPRTPLECAETESEANLLEQVYRTAGLKVARLSLPSAPVEAAAQLYAELHHLDARGADRIIATLPPDTDEWRAIRDRLLRAAAEE